MCKLKRYYYVVLLLSILLIPIYSYASTNYTIDDLRVLMGMQRLSDNGSINEIKRLLSTCYKQNEWNELVLALEDIEDTQLKDFQDKEEEWYKAKEILESNFISNKPIETILSDYINYQTIASLRTEYTKATSFDLSLLDTNDIDAKIAYANSILDSTNDDTYIGVIGNNMKTFTQGNLLISIPFGRSYYIDSGKKLSNNGLTISIKHEHMIYSQFNGIITSVTDNSVTVKTGKSVEIEYIGIQPSVEKKQKVKQYNEIGKTKTKSMTLKFKLNTVYVDPLLLYGSRSVNWYKQWENANPGCTIDKFDYTHLLDNLSEEIVETTPDLNSAGTMINEDDNTIQIIIQGDNNYSDSPDNIGIEKSGTGIISND
jgi:hypothetical protein